MAEYSDSLIGIYYEKVLLHHPENSSQTENIKVPKLEVDSEIS